jgi:hypothetical protein
MIEKISFYIKKIKLIRIYMILKIERAEVKVALFENQIGCIDCLTQQSKALKSSPLKWIRVPNTIEFSLEYFLQAFRSQPISSNFHIISKD